MRKRFQTVATQFEDFCFPVLGLVNTRLEAVRKVMRTVVGLERMAGVATSTYLAVPVA